jgi:hypothetical protein
MMNLTFTSHAPSSFLTSTKSFLKVRRLVRVVGFAVCFIVARPWSSWQEYDKRTAVSPDLLVKTPPATIGVATAATGSPQKQDIPSPYPPAAAVPTTRSTTSGALSNAQNSNLRESSSSRNKAISLNAEPSRVTAPPQGSSPPLDPNLQVIFIPDVALTRQQTYIFPLSNTPDPTPKMRVASAFALGALDSDWQAIFGDDDNNPKCSVTSMIRIQRHDLADSSGTTSDPLWTLQTLDGSGQPKKVGGDEFYITYTAHGHTEPTAIAFLHDWNNGNYSFHFVSSPTAPHNQNIRDIAEKSSGTLSVFLEQTCGMGTLPPPRKQNWLTTGAINQEYTIAGIPAPKHIEKFLVPNADKRINLGEYHQVVVIGDSLLGHFVCADNDKPSVDRPKTFRDNVYRTRQIEAALHGGTMAQPFLVRTHRDIQAATDIWLNRIRQAILEKGRIKGSTREGELLPRDDQGKVIFSLNHLRTIQGLPEIIPANDDLKRRLKLAVVLGSGVWDILADDEAAGGQDFEDHLVACEQLILSVRETHPGVTIYWKSMTAMHNHVVAKHNPTWQNIKRIYYMSNSRARRLDQAQKILMKKLKVPVLDVFDATFYAAHKTRPSDGRHYLPDFNKRVLGWFYA